MQRKNTTLIRNSFMGLAMISVTSLFVSNYSIADDVIMMDDGGMTSAAGHIGHGDMYPMMQPPEVLLINKIASYVGDTVKASTRPYYDMEGNVGDWRILDADGNEILVAEQQADLQWTSTAAGIYTLEYTQSLPEMEVNLSEELVVLDNADPTADLIDRFWEMESDLVGTWVGKRIAHQTSTDVTLIFSDDGSVELGEFGGEIYYSDPFYPPPPPFFGGPGIFPMPPMMPGDMPLGLHKRMAEYELLDIWANGEAEGTLIFENGPPASSNNLRRLRFSSDKELLVFELTFDRYSESELYIMQRAENMERIADLDTLKASILGSWEGQVMTPWADPYEVNFNFEENTYTAESLTPTRLHYADEAMMYSPFYFGAPMYSEALAYQLTEFADGKGSGEISLVLKSGEVVSGTISHIEMSLDQSVMAFTFQHYGKYGPMRYLLKRQ